jgi:predicted AAA+ superfamily ATPase
MQDFLLPWRKLIEYKGGQTMNSFSAPSVTDAKRAALELLIYRQLHNRPLFLEFSALLENPEENCYRFFSFLANSAQTSSTVLRCLWQHLFLSEVLAQENLFTLSAEAGKVTPALLQAAAHDWQRLESLFNIDFSSLAPNLPSWQGLVEPKVPATPFEELILTMANTANWPSQLETLCHFYLRYGAGLACRHWAFNWDGQLSGISQPDPISLPTLVGLERQKELLLANTRQFLKGLPANNALLHGARGTGKSSLVKATCRLLSKEGLHLIEVPKEFLDTLPSLLSLLSCRAAKFIIFIDDLSFEEQETEYKALKACLEGSLQDKPGNILIYATSNRRHLVVESFQDRDEIHGGDTVEEKLSLSDRFGLNITFPSPDQGEYLKIVHSLASSFPISPDELTQRAIEWERRSSGRSGRLARQFVLALAGELGVELTN